MHALLILLAETEAKAPLIMPAWVFPLIAAGFFLLAGIVTWTYRDVANRHADRVRRGSGPAGHGASHGSSDETPHGSGH